MSSSMYWWIQVSQPFRMQFFWLNVCNNHKTLRSMVQTSSRLCIHTNVTTQYQWNLVTFTVLRIHIPRDQLIRHHHTIATSNNKLLTTTVRPTKVKHVSTTIRMLGKKTQYVIIATNVDISNLIVTHTNAHKTLHLPVLVRTIDQVLHVQTLSNKYLSLMPT